MVLTSPRENAILYILNPLYTSLSYFVSIHDTFAAVAVQWQRSKLVFIQSTFHGCSFPTLEISLKIQETLQDFTVRHSSYPPSCPGSGMGFLSHQAGKGKANFQQSGLGNFQEGEDDFRKSSRKLLFYMDYLSINDFQKIS